MVEIERMASEPTRLDGEVHPVPLVFASLFGCLALLGLGLTLFSDGWVVGLIGWTSSPEVSMRRHGRGSERSGSRGLGVCRPRRAEGNNRTGSL